jgi:phage/plasmid primase-like uncharacterized protein
LRDGDHGLVVHCHAGCSWVDILAELRRLQLIGDDRRGEASASDRADDRYDRERRIKAARRIWEHARDPRGSPVVRYLAGRGITIPLPSCLRWAPSCRHPSAGYLPAMVARIDSADGELIGIHRTFLRPDGSGKADIEPAKAMLGRAAGAAVHLGELQPDKPLIIAEGVESALAAMELTQWPAWAALSSIGIKKLIPPAEARDIVIAADRDRSGVGERAARRAAGRWFGEGRRVRLLIPDRIGADPNTLLNEARHAP